MTDVMDNVKREIEVHLSRIAKLFKNPKITLIIRNDDLPDADLILTIDDLDKVIESINKMKKQ